MNYIECGLLHTNLAPRLTVSPRPLLPVSGLSRKYLGIEGLTKFELDSLVGRLSKPKSARSKNTEETSPANPTGKTRFTGKKKMSKVDISSMIDRLTKGGSAKRVPDSSRVQTAEIRRKKGLTASYAWQGYGNYSQRANPSAIMVQ